MRQAKKKCENTHEDADRAEMAAEVFFEELGTNQALGSEKKTPAPTERSLGVTA